MVSKLENSDRVLVVAPQFPSINQPWIDTYLEQLLKNRFELVIYSKNQNAKTYNRRVDDLNLRSYVLSFSVSRKTLLTSLILNIVTLRILRSRSPIRVALNRLNDGSRALSFFSVQPFIRNSSLIGECFIVHSHDEIQAFYFRYFSALRKIPLVTTFHGLPPSGVGQLSAEKRKVLYEYVALVLVNTQFAKDQVCRLGCDESKVRIMPQGLPIDDFPFCPRALPESEEVLQLLTVGRFHRDKGQGYGLLALKRLVNNGIRVHWTFVGVGQDIGRLKKLVSKLGLAENVTFLQGVSSEDLLEFYRTAHIFVLSSNVSPGSHIETQGVVLQEAQASGCVPIASAVGGIPECINHQRDGLLVRQKSSRAIFSAVKYLLARPEEWSKYQCAGRANVEQNFSADVVGEQMSRVLKNTAMTWGKKNEHLLSI